MRKHYALLSYETFRKTNILLLFPFSPGSNFYLNLVAYINLFLNQIKIFVKQWISFYISFNTSLTTSSQNPLTSTPWNQLQHYLFKINKSKSEKIKGCVRYIFASLFFTSKRENLWNGKVCFLFHLKSSFRSWNNQILTFQILKCHDVIKCPNMKHETHFTE